jgi:hypothetical protein
LAQRRSFDTGFVFQSHLTPLLVIEAAGFHVGNYSELSFVSEGRTFEKGRSLIR